MTIDKIAWIHLRDGKILGARSHGKDTYYLPGGKRDPGETDLQTLVREVEEELTVTIVPGTVAEVGTFSAQAHGKADGVEVRMACYTADYEGTLRASQEIEEIGWLTYADRDRLSPVGRLVFDHLHEAGLLS
ncbi:NUDIX domain-containing protein [Amycolatopsis sp. 195334CR]|uniref:NUDIX hydrolase n=1 Tax=Amycolatopsis sp. 195334CR TaxID=2814588 RepID=UPI001A8E87F3|nr:NUDIX domain-containing protein [Amycolatopsis sp. 195334CR]MBN6040106.1 NUDIX domain-containing protein [Amycolatopsis sp. 195334CR]